MADDTKPFMTPAFFKRAEAGTEDYQMLTGMASITGVEYMDIKEIDVEAGQLLTAEHQKLSDEAAQQAMFHDIDVILERLDKGISVQRSGMNALLERLTKHAA